MATLCGRREETERLTARDAPPWAARSASSAARYAPGGSEKRLPDRGRRTPFSVGHLLDTFGTECLKYLIYWRPQGDSNPCYRRERAIRMLPVALPHVILLPDALPRMLLGTARMRR